MFQVSNIGDIVLVLGFHLDGVCKKKGDGMGVRFTRECYEYDESNFLEFLRLIASNDMSGPTQEKDYGSGVPL